jgi:subtilase family serine protease
MDRSRLALWLLGTLAVAAVAYFGTREIGQNLTGPRPDLRFASFVGAKPAVPALGVPFDLTVSILNDGVGALDRDVAVVAFVDDPRNPSQPVRLAEVVLQAPLAPGETRQLAIPTTSPETAQNLELFVAIDPDGDLRETNRENNVIPGLIRVAAAAVPRPDLVLKEIRFDPPAPRSNQDVSIVAVVANEGESATSAPAIVDLYLNDPLGPLPHLPGTVRAHAPPLHPGSQAEVSTRRRFDEAQLVAVHAQVDTDQVIDETDESNNVLGPTVVAIGTAVQSGSPDLVIKSVELTGDDPQVGTVGQLDVTIANRGHADTISPFSLDLYFRPETPNPGFPVPSGDEPSWSTDLRFLAAGQEFQLRPVPLPLTSRGRWTVLARVDPHDEVDEGEDEENNQQELEFWVSNEGE